MSLLAYFFTGEDSNNENYYSPGEPKDIYSESNRR